MLAKGLDFVRVRSFRYATARIKAHRRAPMRTVLHHLISFQCREVKRTDYLVYTYLHVLRALLVNYLRVGLQIRLARICRKDANFVSTTTLGTFPQNRSFQKR